MKVTLLIFAALFATSYTMRTLSTLGADKVFYGNPWLVNKDKATCPDYERTDTWTDPNNNIVYATCMPIQLGNGGQCPRSVNYDKGCDTYNTTNTHDDRWRHNKHFCVEECTYDHDSCPTGSYCRPAPVYLQNTEGTVKNMCAYPQSTPPPHPKPTDKNYYENPWDKDAVNGACNHKDYHKRFFNENVYKYTDSTGTVWGMCMPQQEGDNSSCPIPPNFDDGLDAYNSNGSCFVECSHHTDLCPNGSKCMAAPSDIIVPESASYLKNVCMYQKGTTEKFAMESF